MSNTIHRVTQQDGMTFHEWQFQGETMMAPTGTLEGTGKPVDREGRWLPVTFWYACGCHITGNPPWRCPLHLKDAVSSSGGGWRVIDSTESNSGLEDR